MSLTLIPIIEIYFGDNSIPHPDEFWSKKPNEWEIYRKKCQENYGFYDTLKPIEKGSSFYRLQDLSSNAIEMIVLKKLNEIKKLGGTIPDSICPLYGGFLLKEKNKYLYFPYNVGDLSDLHHWENIANGILENYFIGFHNPGLSQTASSIIFSFGNARLPFDHTDFTIKKSALKAAIIKTKAEFNTFEQRIEGLNLPYKIENLGKRLLYDTHS